MSDLTVTTIATANSTTNLTLKTGNVSSNGIIVGANGEVSIDSVLTIGNSSINTIANSSTVTSAHFDNVSDLRLKDNVLSINVDDQNQFINLRPVEFTWKHDEEKVKNFGLIAQEVEVIYPHVVTRPQNEDEPKAINYIQLISILIAKVQSQEKQIAQLFKIINKDMPSNL